MPRPGILESGWAQRWELPIREPLVGPGERELVRESIRRGRGHAQGGQGRVQETWDWSTEMGEGCGWLTWWDNVGSGEWGQYWSLVWGLGLGSPDPSSMELEGT